MEVNRSAKIGRAFPEWVIAAVVKILAVCVSVDHGTAKFERAHTAFELVGSGFRILHGEMSKAGIAVRTLPDLVRQEIV